MNWKFRQWFSAFHAMDCWQRSHIVTAEVEQCRHNDHAAKTCMYLIKMTKTVYIHSIENRDAESHVG